MVPLQDILLIVYFITQVKKSFFHAEKSIDHQGTIIQLTSEFVSSQEKM